MDAQTNGNTQHTSLSLVSSTDIDEVSLHEFQFIVLLRGVGEQHLVRLKRKEERGERGDRKEREGRRKRGRGERGDRKEREGKRKRGRGEGGKREVNKNSLTIQLAITLVILYRVKAYEFIG